MLLRRLSTLIIATVLAFFIFLTVFPSSRPAIPITPHLPTSFNTTNLPKFEVPKFHFSFQKSAHKPPTQKDSYHAGSSWYSDWKWLNPFSSSITLDQDRIVLPHLSERLPVYTYYESPKGRDKETVILDDDLLKIWRRAWWSKGFRPVVLSEADAMSHPLYQTFQRLDISTELKFEISRWLAWSHMGTGLLASWRCVPMAAYDDLFLTSLRRGRFEGLMRVDGIGAGLFAGESSQIEEAAQKVVADLKMDSSTSLIEVIGSNAFKIEETNSIAYYDSAAITQKYPVLAQLTKEDPIKGRRALNKLVNAHLHVTWQNIFGLGIAVLKPLPAHTTALIEPSLRLAKLLAECPETIMQSSCPPNRPKCSPCVGSRMKYATMGSFHNSSDLFTIGTIPHPYTMVMLSNLTETIDTRYIRRETKRDQWLFGTTRDALGDGRGSPGRLVAFKDFVASETTAVRSMWFVVEDFPLDFYPPPPPPKSPTNEDHPKADLKVDIPDNWFEDLEWQFGFAIPRTKISHGESYTPVPAPDRWAKMLPGMPADRRKSWDPDPPTDDELVKEIKILQSAVRSVRQPSITEHKMFAVAEGWNLADTEAWRFVKAYSARGILERIQWLEEEATFDQTSKGRGKARWW